MVLAYLAVPSKPPLPRHSSYNRAYILSYKQLYKRKILYNLGNKKSLFRGVFRVFYAFNGFSCLFLVSYLYPQRIYQKLKIPLQYPSQCTTFHTQDFQRINQSYAQYRILLLKQNATVNIVHRFKGCKIKLEKFIGKCSPINFEITLAILYLLYYTYLVESTSLFCFFRYFLRVASPPLICRSALFSSRIFLTSLYKTAFV